MKECTDEGGADLAPFHPSSFILHPSLAMPKISPHAVVDPKAQIADDVVVGPFCVIGPNVTIGAGTVLHNGVTITGHTTVGQRNQIFQNAVIGSPPQDKKYDGAPTRLEIGDDNIFREHVTIHCGTVAGGGLTKVGNNNMLLVNAHVGHDCAIADNCTFINNVMIGGHVIVNNNVTLGGCAGILQRCTVGPYSFVTAYSRITHDVPPFVKVDGPNIVRGVNVLGLRRGGFANDDIDAIDDACKRLFYYRAKPFAAAIAEFDVMNGINPHVRTLIEFMRRRDEGKGGRYLERNKH
jgi:UDP-N-acetylglucosamine acyltransferase